MIVSFIYQAIDISLLMKDMPRQKGGLTLSQTTNFRLFQIQRVCKG